MKGQPLSNADAVKAVYTSWANPLTQSTAELSRCCVYNLYLMKVATLAVDFQSSDYFMRHRHCHSWEVQLDIVTAKMEQSAQLQGQSRKGKLCRLFSDLSMHPIKTKPSTATSEHLAETDVMLFVGQW